MEKRINPKGPVNSTEKIIRGGCFFNNYHNYLKTSFRERENLFDKFNSQGFRLVRTKRTKLDKILYINKYDNK